MSIRSLLALLFILVSLQQATAQWPRDINAKSGAVITIYQPQPEKMTGTRIDGRAAFSVAEKPGDDLIFGVFWYAATMATDRDQRTVSLESIEIQDVKLPGIDDTAKIEKLTLLLETEIPTWGLTTTIDEIAATIELEQTYVSEDLNNDPPRILYAAEPTILVLMDGEPVVKDDAELKMKRVINSPFLIVQNPADGRYYLYGGRYWYSSASPAKDYQPSKSLPKAISSLDQQLKKQQAEKVVQTGADPPAVVVSTEPAELIQSKGPADFANISGTNLLYMTNSDDNIFRSIANQQYFVLISGRWYASAKLEGPWSYTAADNLPEDFAKIPEGSAKDNVLASVPGTRASQDAIHDAQVPQTAKVDRKTATCTVNYDGEPKFEKIEGTSLELAVNTGSTVLKSGKDYYCVESGVWFAASDPKGPWKVSDERPKDVEKIPATSPAYSVKYVYVYEATPEVVYVGYTPGYMGSYVYGPTVVYGTGYYYSPWYGPYYYPRPATYGFSVHYNPWTGWSMGFHYSSGWFSFSMGGGYWGPPMYRPPFYPPYHGGMYGGRGPVYIHNDGDINIDRSNNIYNKRNGVTTNDVQRGQGAQARPGTRDQPMTADRMSSRNQSGQTRPATRDQPAGAGQQVRAGQQPMDGPRRNPDVYADPSGNVYQRSDNGNWSQRSGNQWQQTQQPSGMNRDYQNRQRSTQQNSSFQQMNRGGNLGGNFGGGMRPSGGMRRR
jgi:hypothetical protein